MGVFNFFKKNKKDYFINYLDLLSDHLEKISTNEKIDNGYNYKFWFDIIVERAEYPKPIEDSDNASPAIQKIKYKYSLDDKIKSIDAHYKEYSMRYAEMSYEDKIKMVKPRITCFWYIQKEVSKLRHKDLHEYDYNGVKSEHALELFDFHAMTSCYGAAKFLCKDIINGEDILKEIIPHYRDIDNYKDFFINDIKEDEDLINAYKLIAIDSEDILGLDLISMINKYLILNLEETFNQKNNTSYSQLIRNVNSVFTDHFPDKKLDKKIIFDEEYDKKQKIQIKKLLSIIYTFCSSLIPEQERVQQDPKPFIKFAVFLNEYSVKIGNKGFPGVQNLISNLDHEIDDNWVREDYDENSYTLIKYEVNDGFKIISHLKFFVNGKLERFNLSNPDEKKELVKLFDYSNNDSPVVYAIKFFSQSSDEINKAINKHSEKSVQSIFYKAGLFIWKIINSYDKIENFYKWELLNDFACCYFDFADQFYSNDEDPRKQLYVQSLIFSKMALKVDDNSSVRDTIGQAYMGTLNHHPAFDNYRKAVKYDEINDSHKSDHIIGLIVTSCKIGNIESANKAFDLLSKNFPENNMLDTYKKTIAEYANISNASESNEKTYDEIINGLKSRETKNVFMIIDKFYQKLKKKDSKMTQDEVAQNIINKILEKKNLPKEVSRVFGIEMSLGLSFYAELIRNEVDFMAKVLNQYQDNQFDGFQDIEQYHAWYTLIEEKLNNKLKSKSND